MASMTRQHFTLLAARLNAVKPVIETVKIRKSSKAYNAWKRSVIAVASSCAQFNDYFDFDKFYKACGMED